MHKVLDTIDSLLKSAPLSLSVDSDTSLRALQMNDAEHLFAVTDKNRQHLRAWLPWVDSNQNLLDSRRFIQSILDQYRANEGFQCGIWHKGAFAGVVGFHKVDWMNKNVEIGYWLAKEFEGKGIMTKSCKVLVDYAFHESKLKRVQIRCATGNIRSCGIPERLGFRKEGIALQAEYLNGRFVDLVIYGITDTEWAKLRGGDSSTAQLILSSARHQDTESIDAIVKAYYECLNFGPKGKPDYIRLRSLCHQGATFIPANDSLQGGANTYNVEEFIARTEDKIQHSAVSSKGSEKREIARRAEISGTIANIFSGYESRFAQEGSQAIGRGVNSMQLVKYLGRWWIVSVAWEEETSGSAISSFFKS